MINKPPAYTKFPSDKATPAQILKKDLTKLIQKCVLVFDSFSCIIKMFIQIYKTIFVIKNRVGENYLLIDNELVINSYFSFFHSKVEYFLNLEVKILVASSNILMTGVIGACIISFGDYDF